METNYRPATPPRNRGTALRFLGGVLLLIVLFLVGWVPKLKADSKLKDETKSASSASPDVEVVLPHSAIQDKLLLPGSTVALSETAVQARTSGYVQKMFVDIGSHVKQGQVLAIIQSPDADQQLDQANSDAVKSQATVGQSVADVAHAQAGVAQGHADLSRQAAGIANSLSAVASARSRFEGAKSAESAAEARLAQSKQGVMTQKASVLQAQAQYDLAQATEKRYAGLLKEGFVSQQDYDQTAATLKTSDAALQAANSNVEAANSDVDASKQNVQSAKSAVQSAESDVDAAKANLNAAHAAYDSQKATIDADNATVNASRSTVQANQAAYQSSLANARRYSVLSGFEKVVAPFDGVITSRNVDIGSLVSPGQISASSNATTPGLGLFGIARVDQLRIFVNLPQTYYQSVKDGSKVRVMVRELPKQQFEATVFQASGALDAASRTLLTEVRLDNRKGLLLPGMFAQVQFDTGGQSALRVPSNTLIIDSKGNRVAIVGADNKVHYQTVVIGKDFGTEVEILDGVKATDRLISNPSDELQEGETVDAELAKPEDAKA
jgi:RND family efflux transporter MFP subunit